MVRRQWNAAFLLSSLLLAPSHSTGSQMFVCCIRTVAAIQDAKFGIFIHWGVYSVPAWAPVGDYAEWYWNDLESGNPAFVQFHNTTYGPNFRYQDFAPMFKAELFNATEWADIFRRSGAKYTVPTSKHHEGFTNWPSAVSWNWNSVDIGPHRNLLKEIMDATRAAGLHAGMYFSIYEWYNPFYLTNVTEYVQEILFPQWYDLINNYQPEILWSDGDWEQTSKTWGSEAFLAWVFNSSPVKDTIVVDDRWGSDTSRKHGSFYTPEYSSEVYLNHKWEASQGIDIHSYGLNRNTRADQYFSAQQLLNTLIRCVANGGNFLLDIGPRSDGTIPTLMQDRLLEIGAWLAVNGEGVYSTRIWRVQQEGNIDNTTIRYTRTKDNSTIYAFLLTFPSSFSITLPSPIPGSTAAVSMLGVNGSLKWQPATPGITVQLPQLTPVSTPCKYIWTLKLTGFS